MLGSSTEMAHRFSLLLTSPGALKRLEDDLPLFLSVPPTLSLPCSHSLSPPTFCPHFGLCPDNQSQWWLCFQLSPPPSYSSYQCTISFSGVGNVQESRSDKPKEMFWENASTAEPSRDQPQFGIYSEKKNYEWSSAFASLKGFDYTVLAPGSFKLKKKNRCAF